MTKRCQQWTIQRQSVPALNGWSRWDQPYQQILQGTWSKQGAGKRGAPQPGAQP